MITTGSRALAAQRGFTFPRDAEAGGRSDPTAALEAFRRRNALLDAFFYDVKVISEEEAMRLAPWTAREGAFLLVPPSVTGVGVSVHLSPSELAAAGGGDAKALALAGVGASALGSAAFARNVADAIEAPVVSVVSGYGMADLAAEALGGFFLFGMLNGYRHILEGLDRILETTPVVTPGLSRDATSGLPPKSIVDAEARIRASRDTMAVVSLLLDERFSFSLLTGHSKGNLLLSEALFQVRESARARLRQLAETRIVTFSAKIAMPNGFREIADVMGSLDGFGLMNSRPDIPTDRIVPFVWHHTNTEIPAHLPVTPVLRDVLGL